MNLRKKIARTFACIHCALDSLLTAFLKCNDIPYMAQQPNYFLCAFNQRLAI